MGTSQFDIGQLTEAAGSYEAAAQQATAARQALAGSALDPSALGGTASSLALGSALKAFHDTHAQAAQGNASALTAFAAKLHGLSAIGEESVAQTSAAAGI
ncbi:hypothetical protein [Blastococcus sp. Marseille-P5729]|uniref:hypothetical protein n=1 Tax=Blastococcus sp. Marseille-P5729 TaxID=2086582 RepID=UPI000D10BD4C|nr:hypothetical protein [Blastococcus sp. Marseille-P5729]